MKNHSLGDIPTFPIGVPVGRYTLDSDFRLINLKLKKKIIYLQVSLLLEISF